MRTSTSTMIHLDEAVATDPLRCDHASGEVSMRITAHATTNWLVGTPAQWRDFANHIANLTDEIVRGDQFTDEADFDESRASDEVWS